MKSFRSKKFMLMLALMLTISLLAVPAAFACGDTVDGDHDCEGGSGQGNGGPQFGKTGDKGDGTGDGQGGTGGLKKGGK